MHAATPRSGTERTLAQLLRLPYRALVEELYARLARAGYPELQPAHSSVFPHIRDGVGRGSDLAAHAHLTKQSVAYLVDSLESAGLVERVPDPSDGRAKIIQLTKRGLAAERAAARIMREIELEWAAGLGAVRLRELRDGLDQLCDRIEDA